MEKHSGKNLNHSGDVGKFRNQALTTANYLKTLGIKHLDVEITVSQYNAWKKTALFARLAGTTLGDSFCEQFGIQDLYLQLADISIQDLELHVHRYYCPRLRLTA